MKYSAVLFFVFLPVLAFSQFGNKKVKVDEAEGTPPNQAFSPAIVISRKNPKNMAIACFVNKIHISSDTGANWTKGSIESSLGNAGYMKMAPERKGDFYNFHTADSKEGKKMDRVVCQRSNDGGLSWDDGGFAGLDPVNELHFYRPAVHPHSGALYLSWTSFNKYGSSDPAHKSNILFSQSKDGGKWSKPVQINQQPGNCSNDDQTAVGSTPVVSMDGKIAVVWTWNEKIYLDRSYNKGDTWLTNDLEVANQTGGWSMSVPGLPHCHGTPVVIIDNGFDHFHGSLYITWADQRNGADDTDIWFIRSANFGDYWSQPIRIGGTVPKKHQFQPAAAVDQATGYIYIAYYDRSKYDDPHTDLILGYSVDGGTSFSYATVSENFLLPSESMPYDDYIQIDAYRGIITPVWVQSDNDKATVWTSVIRHQDLVKKK